MLRLRYTFFAVFSITVIGYFIFHFSIFEDSLLGVDSLGKRIQLSDDRIVSPEDVYDPDSKSNKPLNLGSKLPSWKSWRSFMTNSKSSNPTFGSKILPGISKYEEEDFNIQLAEEVKEAPQAIRLVSTARIAKCTIVFGNLNPVYERALKTHEAHNEKHGYPMYILRQSILDDVWTKPAYILSLILRELAKPVGERLEWLFWVDADTIMLNIHIPIEVFLPPSHEWDDINLMISHDMNGLNNGVFPIRVHPWSAELLSAIVAFRHYRPNDDLTFRDQSAMSYLLEDRKFSTHTLIVPQRWFNAYQGEHNETLAPFQVRRGDFLVHFAGVPDRDNRMKYWLDRAEKHSPDWEIEIQHTTFPEEIRNFWADLTIGRDASQHALEMARGNASSYMKQIEQWLKEYSDDISEAEKKEIDESRHRLDQILVNEGTKTNIDAINEAFDEFNNVTKSLSAAALEADRALIRIVHNVVFEAEAASLSLPDSDEFKEERDSILEKAATLKQLVHQSEWNRSEVEETLERLRVAHLGLKRKMQQGQDKQQPDNLKPAGSTESMQAGLRERALHDRKSASLMGRL